MRLRSGPARSDTLYFLVFFGICAGLTYWFYRDGSFAWLEHNRKEARKQLTPLMTPGQSLPPTFGASPTGADFKKLREKQPTRIEDVRAALGAPFATKPAADGRGTVEYFASDYGMASVPVSGGVVDPARLDWKTWYKDKGEIDAQFYWMLIPVVFGLYAGYRGIRAATLSAVIDDSGLTYGGQRIAFAAMTGLRDYSPKGWIDLHYTQDGRERKLRIDNTKIDKFDEIVAELCREKGFVNPIPAKSEE